MWRSAVALLVAALAAAGLYRLVYVPYRCNVIEGNVVRSTERIAQEPDRFAIRRAAERNVRELMSCVDACPADVQLRTLAAANLIFLGRVPAAEAMYESALRYDRRPEILLGLANTQAASGRQQEAIRSLVTAGRFSGKDYILQAEDGLARHEAYRIVAEEEARAAESRGERRLTELVFNGDFSAVGERGPKTSDSGNNQAWPSAADAWLSVASTETTVTTELVPSTRRPGGKMLRVTAGAAGSGVVQVWGGRRGVAPANAMTAAWVYVRRGQVAVGSGFESITWANAQSTTTARWERVAGRNASCPVNQTNIFAATPDTDFDVDLIEVTEVPGPPCDRPSGG